VDNTAGIIIVITKDMVATTFHLQPVELLSPKTLRNSDSRFPWLLQCLLTQSQLECRYCGNDN